jgi:hypothetical protein
MNAFNVTVKRKIEIQTGLLAIRDDFQPGRQLVVNGTDRGIILNLGQISWTKFVQLAAGHLQPAWKGITANDGGAKWNRLHQTILESRTHNSSLRDVYRRITAGGSRWIREPMIERLLRKSAGESRPPGGVGPSTQ